MKILFIMVFLTSCAVNVLPQDFQKGEELCKDSGGLHHINADMGSVDAVCNYTKENEMNRRFKRIATGKR